MFGFWLVASGCHRERGKTFDVELPHGKPFLEDEQVTFLVPFLERTLDWPLNSRFHYGHPDLMDKLQVVQQGGVSKAQMIAVNVIFQDAFVRKVVLCFVLCFFCFVWLFYCTGFHKCSFSFSMLLWMVLCDFGIVAFFWLTM